MIAIALVLVLIVGVAQVFQMTSQTVSSGQALSALTRDARAAETTMTADIDAMVAGSDQPAVIIWNQRAYAFLNENDAATDLDGLPWTTDATGDGVEGNAPGELIAPASLGARNHRIDMLSFFVSGYYRRQTGADNSELVSAAVSTEAWVNYGHLIVPRYPNAGDHAKLQELANRGDTGRMPPSWVSLAQDDRLRSYQQQYARNWVLGRSVVLLDSSAERGVYTRGGGTALPLNPNSPGTLDASVANPVTATFHGRDARLYTSRFDVARENIGRLRSDIYGTGSSTWYKDALLFRFEADPMPDAAGGYDASEIARTAPIFLRNCTGFVVEFAGDFFSQVDDGTASAGMIKSNYKHAFGTDGKIDFFFEELPGGERVKKIRWYGLPRDSNGDGTINPYDTMPIGINWELSREWLAGMASAGQNSYGVPGPCPFERDVSQVFPGASTPQDIISKNQPASGLGYLDPQAGLRDRDFGTTFTNNTHHVSDDAYLCAFASEDRKPAMIRVTLFLNDPNNRLPEGQVYQYVLKLPGN
jgi:type II secretory pathway pseudopilin PulG